MNRFLGHDTKYDEHTPSLQKIMLVQAVGGIIAGASSSCITTPLDTIKTRLQVCIVSLNWFISVFEFIVFGSH